MDRRNALGLMSLPIFGRLFRAADPATAEHEQAEHTLHNGDALAAETPDHVIVVHSAVYLDYQSREHLRQSLKRNFPGREVVIMPPGLTLSVIKA